MKDSQIQYYCTHCTHQFTDEDKDVVECPKCFWSSSVKRASEVNLFKETKKANAKEVTVAKKKFGKVYFLIFILSIAAVIVFLFLNKHEARPVHKQRVKTEIPVSDLLVKDHADEEMFVEVVSPELTQEDLDFLSVTQTYEEILKNLEIPSSLNTGVTIKLGLVEKLPSQPWELEQFEEMIVEQEKNYKVPLNKSYKKKLNEHFETYYLEGKRAFEDGDYLRARDEFVKTLAFPIYANDIKRHRGVALTILRPFINDTLSKVGALNTILVDKNLRSIEAQIQDEYQALLQLITNHSWDDSLVQIKKIQAMINDLQNKNLNEMRAPDYPQPLMGLDPSIGASLADILQPSQTLLSDLNPLNQDLVKKYKVIESLSAIFLRKELEKYNLAASAFAERDWKKGVSLLQEIKAPKFLIEKSIEKLKKIQELNLEAR